nr:EAL domain-containing protein [Rhabdothermincola salaria]
MCDHDADFTVRHVWGEVRALLGLSPDDLVGRDFSAFIHPDDLAMVHREVSIAVDAEKPYDLRYRIRRADGAVRWVWEQGGRAAIEGLLEGLLLDVTDWVEAEQERSELGARYRSLLENLDEAVVLVDAGVVVYANQATELLLRARERPVVGRRVADVVHPHDLGRSQQHRDSVRSRPDRVVRHTYRVLADDGATLEVGARVTVVQLQGRQHLQIVIRDISSARRAARFRQGVDRLLARAVAGVDVDDVLVDLARLAEERLGARRVVLLSVHDGRLRVRADPGLPPEVRAMIHDVPLASLPWLDRAMTSGNLATHLPFQPPPVDAADHGPASRGWVAAARSRTSSGDDVVALVMGRDDRPPEDLDTDLVHEVRNIAASIMEQARRREADIEADLTDPLTGLPSRTAVVEGLRRALREGLDGRVTVLTMEIDELARVDQSLGHDASGALVVHVARCLENAVTSDEFVGRLTDGRFAVLCPGLAERTTVEERIAALRATISDVAVDHHVLRPSISVGVATSRLGTEADALLSDAIGALGPAGDHGPSHTAWFDQADRGRARRRLETEIALRQGLDRGEIVPHYQPRVRIQDGTVVGAEALARWERPGIGTVGPNDFIALAEEIALIGAIDRAILRQACHDAAAWPDDERALSVSVNISARQLADPDLVGVVTDALAESGLDPTQLVLEVTESTMVEVLDTQHRHPPGPASHGGPRRHRRLRHGLLVAGLPQAPRDRRAQDRPVLRGRPPQRRRRRPGGGHLRSGPAARHRGRRRRGRDRAAARHPARARL